MKRASEVPPLVLSSGLRPVTSSIAATARSVKGPGFVTNTLAFEGSHTMRARIRLPAALRHALLDQRPQRLLGVAVVEADVEFRAGLRRDDIAGGVADIDRGEFEVRCLELGAALIERLAR